MAVRVINPARTIEFILEDDRASEDPTVFVLRPMTWEQLGEFNSASPLSSENAAEIANILRLAREEERELTADEAKRVEDLAGGVQATLPLNRQYALALRFGLVEVRGLLDQDRSPLRCTPEEFVRMASTNILAELAGEILRLSQLSEDDRKNSRVPPDRGSRVAPVNSAHDSPSFHGGASNQSPCSGETTPRVSTEQPAPSC